MSQKTKCREARKKAAWKRERETAEKRKNLLLPLMAPPMPSPTFNIYRIDRKEIAQKEDAIRKSMLNVTHPKPTNNKHPTILARYETNMRYSHLLDHYHNKMDNMHPIAGTTFIKEESIRQEVASTGTIFIKEDSKNLERIRMQQEVASTELLKRKFAPAEISFLIHRKSEIHKISLLDTSMVVHLKARIQTVTSIPASRQIVTDWISKANCTDSTVLRTLNLDPSNELLVKDANDYDLIYNSSLHWMFRKKFISLHEG